MIGERGRIEQQSEELSRLNIGYGIRVPKCAHQWSDISKALERRENSEFPPIPQSANQYLNFCSARDARYLIHYPTPLRVSSLHPLPAVGMAATSSSEYSQQPMRSVPDLEAEVQAQERLLITFSCPICLEVGEDVGSFSQSMRYHGKFQLFNKSSRAPSTLPCGHTFCMGCLQLSNARGAHSRQCAQCRETFSNYTPTVGGMKNSPPGKNVMIIGG